MLKRCCCCIDLRTGCIIIAILGIITSAGWFTYTEKNDAYYVVLSGSIMGLIGNLSLLFGAIMTNKIAVAIYLILEFVQLMLNFAFSILVFVAYSATGGSESASNLLVIGIMALIIMMVWIYLWLSAFSFFLEIKRREP